MRLLKAGALAQGSATELCTLRRAWQLIEEKFGRRYSESQAVACISLGFSSQGPTSRMWARFDAGSKRAGWR